MATYSVWDITNRIAYVSYLIHISYDGLNGTGTVSGTQRLDCIHVDSIRLRLALLYGSAAMNGTD